MDWKYRVIRSKRKTSVISINQNLDVIVRVPYRISDIYIKDFVNKNREWINKNLLYMKQRQVNNPFNNITEKDIIMLKQSALNYIPERVKYFSKLMNLSPTGVKITSAKKRWGSCSYKNSLCFSYRLMLMDKLFIDYVIIHELTHIKIKNHSKIFYDEIAKYMPNFREVVKKSKLY